MPALLILATINLVTFCVFGYDKACARRQAKRIPERDLLLLVTIGGAAGAVAGQYCFRHKTAKRSFNRRMWIIIAIQTVLLSLLFWAFALR